MAQTSAVLESFAIELSTMHRFLVPGYTLADEFILYSKHWLEAAMHGFRFAISTVLLVIVAGLFIGCGNRNYLRSMSVSPAAADAQDYPNGQVQFTASGIYANGNQVKPLISLWTPGVPWTSAPWPDLSLGATGLASCGSAKPGIYTILATAPIDPSVPVSQMSMTTPQLNGMAQLTCP